MQPNRSNPAELYRPIDPFVPSLSYRRTLSNALRSSGIGNVDDVPLPSLAAVVHHNHPGPRSSSRSRHYQQQALQPIASERPTITEPRHQHSQTIVQIYQHSENSILNLPPVHSENIYAQPSNHQRTGLLALGHGLLVENSLVPLPPSLPNGEQSRGGYFPPGSSSNSTSQVAQNIIVLNSEGSRGRSQSRYQGLPSYSHSSRSSRCPSPTASSTRSRSCSNSSNDRLLGYSPRSSSPFGSPPDVETGTSAGPNGTGSQADIVEHFPFPDHIEAFTSTVLRQIYLHTLLRLPYLYFSRVDRIFLQVKLTLPEIKHMALEAGAAEALGGQTIYNLDCHLTPSYQNLKETWENFIDNLVKEWKITNVISALVLAAVMTAFQIQAISQDPVTRYLFFWSLFCALFSLLFGYILILQFDTMRTPFKAFEWAFENKKELPPVLWNVWVMLSMPVVWFIWSFLIFVVGVVCFMWRSSAGPSSSTPPIYPTGIEHGFRIFLCIVLGMGVTYGVCLVKTLRRYGSAMDKAWKTRIENYVRHQDSPQPPQEAISGYSSSGPPSNATVVVETTEQVNVDTSTTYSTSPDPGGEGSNSGGAEGLSQTHSIDAGNRETVQENIELAVLRLENRGTLNPSPRF